MKDRIIDSVGKIDNDMIEAVDKLRENKSDKHWARWIAACFCIVVITAVIIVVNGFGNNLEQPIANDEPSIVIVEKTSDTYENLPELLEYLSRHDNHDDRKQDASGGSNISVDSGASENPKLVENTGVAVSNSGEYAYHIGENDIYISRLEGENTVNAGSINVAADGLFICNENLFVVSQFESGGDEFNPEVSVQVRIYDIAVPTEPILKDEYIQLGTLTACWMVGAEIYLVTGDGVCACGWSRLEDSEGYYPALMHNGEQVAWDDEDISILGEPTRVQYSAITVINGNSGEVVGKEALYGDIHKIFYGEDWIAATVAGETEKYRENPSVYTFDGNLDFTGRINTASILNVSETNKIKNGVLQSGDNIGIVSVTKYDGVYRMLGTYSNKDGGSFMAIAVDTEKGKVGTQLLKAGEDYPYSSFTEIRWEPDRAIICVGVMNDAYTNNMELKTRFIFAEFDGIDVSFRESELTADYMDGRVGTSYGNPLDEFETLIPMGQGIYLRYSNPAEGPGGFDVFDFSNSAEPKLLYRAKSSLSGDDAFDYVWYVYDEHTFGTLKVILGDEDYFRDVKLAWCIYAVDINSDTPISLLSETVLDGEIRTFFGADGIGFVVFSAGENVYCLSKDTSSCGFIG